MPTLTEEWDDKTIAEKVDEVKGVLELHYFLEIVKKNVTNRQISLSKKHEGRQAFIVIIRREGEE